MENAKLIGRVRALALGATALALWAGPASAQDRPHKEAQMQAVQLRIPESMGVEHAKIHDRLIEATSVARA